MRKGIVITVGNEKGGVGKTTISRHIPYSLALRGKKVLCIDMDTQASLTKSLFVTRSLYHDNIEFKKTLMLGIEEGNLKDLTINVMDNFDFIPSGNDLESYPTFLAKKFGLTDKKDENYVAIKKRQLEYFKSLIATFKNDYDFIFIDTPPTASDFTYSAAYASDYILIAFQTQSDSLDGAMNYFNNTLVHLVQDFDAEIEILGVLPNQLHKTGMIDNQVMHDAYDVFGENNVFKNIIPFTKSIQNIPRKGITRDGYWENKMFENVFEPITDEFLEKLNLLEKGRE